MAANELDPWDKDSHLGQAFDLNDSEQNNSREMNNDSTKTASAIAGSSSDTEEQDSKEIDEEQEKFATSNNRYPVESKEEAIRSLNRAAENEGIETFKKIANKIENLHPEIAKEGSIEKTAELGYELGKNMAEGFFDNIS